MIDAQPSHASALTVTTKNRFLVCGIGNPMLKDDRAGIEVAERIESMMCDVDVEIIHGVGFEVLDKVLGYDEVVVVDAAKMGYPAGTIREVSVDDIFSDHRLASSHAVTLGSTLKVGYRLFAEEMPERLTVILIEAADYFEFTKQCTPSVLHAIDVVVQRITDRFNGKERAAEKNPITITQGLNP